MSDDDKRRSCEMYCNICHQVIYSPQGFLPMHRGRYGEYCSGWGGNQHPPDDPNQEYECGAWV